MDVRTLFLLWISLLFLGNVVLAVPNTPVSPSVKPSSPTGVPQPGSNENSDVAFKSALLNSENQLGILQPWQTKIFDEEVIPQFQRFIKDYRLVGTTTKTLNVEVDLASLKHYLVFYGPPFFKVANPQMVVFLKYDPSCTPCLGSLDKLKALIQTRLANRGVTPIWANPSDLALLADKTSDKIEDQLMALVRDKKAVGGLLVEWSTVQFDEVEATLGEDKRYVIHATMQLGEIIANPPEKELLDTDAFETSCARLLTDIFTEVGAKIELEQLNGAQSDKNEVLLTVSGIQDFYQYTRIKNLLSTSLKEILSFEERKLSKGRAVFAIYTINPEGRVDMIKKQMSTLNLEPGLGSNQALTVEIR